MVFPFKRLFKSNGSSGLLRDGGGGGGDSISIILFSISFIVFKKMWGPFIRFIIIGDVMMNFFFHILQFRKFCSHEQSIGVIIRKVLCMEAKLDSVDGVTRDISARMRVSEIELDVVDT